MKLNFFELLRASLGDSQFSDLWLVPEAPHFHQKALGLDRMTDIEPPKARRLQSKIRWMCWCWSWKVLGLIVFVPWGLRTRRLVGAGNLGRGQLYPRSMWAHWRWGSLVFAPIRETTNFEFPKCQDKEARQMSESFQATIQTRNGREWVSSTEHLLRARNLDL